MEMEEIAPINLAAFKTIHLEDFCALNSIDPKDVEPFLPCLVRRALFPSAVGDFSADEFDESKTINYRQMLLQIPASNSVISAHQVNFPELESDLRKDLKLKKKSLHAGITSKLEAAVLNSAVRFENGLPGDRFRLVLSELLYIQLWLNERKLLPLYRKFEIFDDVTYFNDISYLFCIMIAELKNTIDAFQLCRLLLYYRNGPYFIQRIAANFPHLLEKTINIVENFETGDEENLLSKQRTVTIDLLCALNPSSVNSIVLICLQRNVLPACMLHLMLSYCHFDVIVAQMEYIWLKSSPATRHWFTSYIQNAQKHSPKPGLYANLISQLKNCIMERVSDVLNARSNEKTIKAETVSNALEVLKFYVIIRHNGNVRFNDEEHLRVMELLTSKLEPTFLAVQCICQSLAALATIPNVFGSSSFISESENLVEKWIRWLIEAESEFDTSLASTSSNRHESYSEMLLLMAIHLHSNQHQQLSQLVSNILGMKVQVRPNAVIKLKQIFQNIFGDMIVAERAAKVPVTKNLSANITGYLPIHCIHQLLSSRSFAKHQVVIKDWIWKQLAECTVPIHEGVPAMIEAYVQTCLNGPHLNEPLSESDILAVFKCNPMEEKSLTHRILLMFYVLYFDETRLVANRNIAHHHHHHHHSKALPKYASVVLDAIPVKYLVGQMQKNFTDYTAINPQLMRLTMNYFSYLFAPTEPLAQCSVLEKLPAVDVFTTSEEIDKALKNIVGHPIAAYSALLTLLRLPLQKSIEHFESVLGLLPKLLEVSVPQLMLMAYVELWERFETIFPRKLYTVTIGNLLLEKSSQQILKHDEVCFDPLIALRVNPKVFRCPPLMQLILRIISSYLFASRIELQRQILAAPPVASKGQKVTDGGRPMVIPPETQEKEREELMNALIGAQESAAVQILLELCLPIDEAERLESSQVSTLREIQCLVCSALHQIFITDPMLMKLVHFQGYHHDLIPVTVAGIPSMHICLEFIPMLMQQPDYDKLIFGVDLLSHICVQYSIPRAFTVSRLAFSILNTLLGSLTADHVVNLFSAVLDPILRMAKTFPPLYKDATGMLLQVGKICLSLLTVNGNLAPIDVSIGGGAGADTCTGAGLSGRKEFSLYQRILRSASEDFPQSAYVNFDL